MKERTRFDVVVDEMTGRDVEPSEKPLAKPAAAPSMVMVVAPNTQATFADSGERIHMMVYNAGDRPLRFAVSIQWVES